MAGVEQQIYRGSGKVGSAAALPEASPASFGAGVGDAIAGAASAVEASSNRAIAANKERERDSANAQASVDAAQLSIDLTRSAQASRDEAPIDGGGHLDRVAQESQSAIDAFLEKIPDQRVREHWRARVAQMRGTLIEQEDGWARGRRISAIGTNGAEAGRLWDNQLQSNPDPTVFEQALHAGDDFWNGVTAPADVKDKGLREWKAGRAQNFARGLVEKDPASALHLLETGALDAWLDPNDRKTLVDEAQSGVRIAAADARRVATQAEQQVRQDKAEITQRIDRGELPSDDEVKGLVGRAQALGLTDLVDDIGYSVGKLKMSRETDKWTPADWEHNINSLAAKVATKKASAEEQVQLRVLQDLRSTKEARFRQDPEGYAAASGISAPQVDIANPDAGTVQARKSWARAYARTAQLVEPPYLSKDQLQVYVGRANQGPVGRLEVAAELRDTWGMDAAPSIVRQIGGEGKADMLVMLGLNDRMSQVYQHGSEALSKKSLTLNEDLARQTWAHYANAVPADLRPALFDAARNITAGWMLEQGRTAPTADFADVFSKALHRAAGMLGSWGEGSATGGFANFNGRFAWLPQDMARGDFLGRISRAQPGDWRGAAVDRNGNPSSSGPYHLGHDGKRVPYADDELRRFGRGTLQTVAPGIYQLVDPAGGVVVDANGRPWQFDIRRLPRGHFGR